MRLSSAARGGALSRWLDRRHLALLRPLSLYRCGADVCFEEGNARDHQSNGVIEQTVRRFKGQFRTLRYSVESRYASKNNESDEIVARMVLYACAVANSYQVGDDGKAAYERPKGKRFSKAVAEFGENLSELMLMIPGEPKQREGKEHERNNQNTNTSDAGPA